MKKRNIRGFFVGERGQRLFNYAYSIGASVVIVGALFKLLHWPFADFILIVGMGTEAAIFFLSAFDEPAKEYKWEKVYPELDIPNDEEAAIARLERIKEGGSVPASSPVVVSGGAPAGNVTIVGGSGIPSGGTVIIGGGGSVPASSAASVASGEIAAAASSPVVSPVSPLNINNEEVNEVTEKYVAQLKSISEQMVALNRSVQGLDAIYEVQLKSVSSQLGSVEQVSQQTQQLVQNLQQLNEVYARMIQAMTASQQHN